MLGLAAAACFVLMMVYIVVKVDFCQKKNKDHPMEKWRPTTHVPLQFSILSIHILMTSKPMSMFELQKSMDLNVPTVSAVVNDNARLTAARVLPFNQSSSEIFK